MKLFGKTRAQIEIERVSELAVQVRAERDRRIAAVQWRKDRHADELALGLTPTEPIEPVLTYIQALRDAPDQPGFPENITWPEEP